MYLNPSKIPKLNLNFRYFTRSTTELTEGTCNIRKAQYQLFYYRGTNKTLREMFRIRILKKQNAFFFLRFLAVPNKLHIINDLYLQPGQKEPKCNQSH